MRNNNIATVALLRHGGSHLIRPIVANLGFDIVEPGNFGAPLDQAVGSVIVFLRDPRNRMIATLRWWRNKGKAGLTFGSDESDDVQLRYLLEHQGFLAEMLKWARIWCKWSQSNPLHVYFETINSKVVSAVADHLDLPPNAERDTRIFNNVYGHGRTYTGSHSNWKDSFGPLSFDYWKKNGGDELLSLMGYT